MTIGNVNCNINQKQNKKYRLSLQKKEKEKEIRECWHTFIEMISLRFNGKMQIKFFVVLFSSAHIKLWKLWWTFWWYTMAHLSRIWMRHRHNERKLIKLILLFSFIHSFIHFFVDPNSRDANFLFISYFFGYFLLSFSFSFCTQMRNFIVPKLP